MSMRSTGAATMAVTIAIAMAACSRSAKEQIADGAAGREMTVTGCLQQGDQGESYILRTTADNRQRATTYRVVGPRDANLPDHVNTRVSITGNVMTVPVNTADSQVGANANGGSVGTSGKAQGAAPRTTPGGTPANTDASTKAKAQEKNERPSHGENVAPQDARADLADMQVLRAAKVEKIGGDCGAAR